MPIPVNQIAWRVGDDTAETAAPHGPPPNPRITVAHFYRIDDVVTPTINIIMGYGQLQPLVPEPDSQLRAITSRLLDRNAKRRVDTAHKSPTSNYSANLADDLSFLRSMGRPQNSNSDSNRLLVRIMFERDVERRGYAFVKMVAENMMSSGKEIGHLNVQLWLGYQAWFGDTITAWGRAKTLLEARDFRILVHTKAAKHKREEAARLARAAQAGHHLAILPSLTARQARRSRLDEQTLRARWG